MSLDRYDAIIVGAGHNGLAAAAYLARAGKKVLVLERRSVVGGSVVTESFGDGFEVDSLWAGGALRPDIVRDLKLQLPAQSNRPPFVAMRSDAESLVLSADPGEAADSIRRFSAKDAQNWPDFVRFMDAGAEFLDAAYATRMPRLPKNFGLAEGYGLLEMGLDLRLMGRTDMLRLIRMLPMTAAEFLEEWFELEQLKSALASVAIHGVTLGPLCAGTGCTLLHNWLNRRGLAQVNVGRAGEITRALANAVTGFGGTIRLNAEVSEIRVDAYACRGVVLSGGEEIAAATVVSAADPKRTFLSLVGPMNLPPEFVWQIQSIKLRGSVAKLHLLTDGEHGIPPGTIAIAPTIQYLERAYDAAKYGEISQQPLLEITTCGNVVSVHFQFAPFALRNASWEEKRQHLGKVAMSKLAEYFPKLGSSVLDSKLIAPVDLEKTYSLTEGDLNHGQLMLDQFLFMRPIPGWSDHRTPIDGLFLCGSGVHGGGGVSGGSGRNAARVVLAHL